MVTLHAGATWSRYMQVLHGHATCRCYMVTLHAGATWSRYMEVLHGHATCRCYMVTLHAGATWPRYMQVRHGHATCRCYMVTLHAGATWPRYMQVLHVAGFTPEHVSVRPRPNKPHNHREPFLPQGSQVIALRFCLKLNKTV